MTHTAPNATHDPSLLSWVESANDPATDYPIQNLPWCMIYRNDGVRGPGGGVTPAVRIGDSVLDVGLLHEAGVIDESTDHHGPVCAALGQPTLNLLAELPAADLSRLRARIQWFLNAKTTGGQSLRRVRDKAVLSASEVQFVQPLAHLNYTDFYASIHHATTVGRMFRPDNPLLPNYKWVPIGYHGRASSIIISGTEVRRPRGQQSPSEGNPAAAPAFGPCTMLDYELEVGCVIGRRNRLGEPIAINDAEDHIFGLCLVNDWSARDLQKWEYQPLGPFLAKNFATTVSDSITTLEALAPFRCPALERPEGDPKPLAYLSSERNSAAGGFDLTLQVLLQTSDMAKRGMSPHPISTARSFREMYWTFAQLITHHTSNGCNLQPGDLLASGTVSGPGSTERGCLLELTWDAPGKPRKPIALPSGETRIFLQDGDTVILRAWCEREGFRRVGLGECRGTITPAPTT